MFGIGEHFCLGANLARLELGVIFRALLKRIEYLSWTVRVLTLFGGIKLRRCG